jgi:hypothetical protein
MIVHRNETRLEGSFLLFAEDSPAMMRSAVADCRPAVFLRLVPSHVPKSNAITGFVANLSGENPMFKIVQHLTKSSPFSLSVQLLK